MSESPQPGNPFEPAEGTGSQPASAPADRGKAKQPFDTSGASAPREGQPPEGPLGVDPGVRPDTQV